MTGSSRWAPGLSRAGCSRQANGQRSPSRTCAAILLSDSDGCDGRRVHPKATPACPEASPSFRHEYAPGSRQPQDRLFRARRTTVKDLKEEIGKVCFARCAAISDRSGRPDLKGHTMRYAYPFTVTPDEDGRLVVAFPDVEGASTDGADETEAIANAPDCLMAALIGYITSREPIPRPSPARGRPTVTLPPLVAAKLALYSAMLEQHVTAADLANRMGKSEMTCGGCWISITAPRLARSRRLWRRWASGWRSRCATRRRGGSRRGEVDRRTTLAEGWRPNRPISAKARSPRRASCVVDGQG